MSRLSIRLLGPFLVASDGKAITGFRSDKARALLVYLAVESDRPHRREKLAGLLWPDYPERSARGYLRVALANLRQVIGDQQATPPFLLISRQTIQFNQASDAWIDAQSVLSLLQTGQPTIERLEDAAGQYQGEFMAGFSLADSPAFEEWALLTREQLHRLVIEALHQLSDSLEARGEVERALVFAWQQVDLDPWREAAHRQVMRLLALSGRRSAALAQYRHCCQVLEEELGVDASAETQQLCERLKRDQGLPGAPALLLPKHNLPGQSTSFEGREEELERIGQRLSDPACRLLTLLGPGGIGKTRLALEAAANQTGTFADGVYFVPLESVSAPELVVPAVADALRFPLEATASTLEAKGLLLGHLAEKSVLLLMDNFEQLVGGRGFLVDILERAPGAKLLVTSRERLSLLEEWVFEVGGLSYPDNAGGATIEEYGAVMLFLARARQSHSRFSLSADERPHVVSICRLLAGLPLGIELAAAWVPVLSCQEIAHEIEAGIDILASPVRERTDRHRSLRVAFDHSWNLLTEEARSGFRKLSVFRGGFTREAGMAVADMSLILLSELANKSLLRRNAQGRYETHGLLRQYAEERLIALPEEWQEVHERHSRYYVAFLSSREPDLYGERLREIKDEIHAEMENVRAAVDWAVANWRAAVARNALASLDGFYVVEGWHEGEMAFARIAETLREADGAGVDTGASDGSPLWAALAYEALYASLLGESEAAELNLQVCLPALDTFGPNVELAVCHFAAGVNAFYYGEYTRAQGSFEMCVSLARVSQADRWVGNGLMWLGWTLAEMGDAEAAKACYEESFSAYREQDNRWGMAYVLSKQGLLADGLQDYAQAKRCGLGALQILTGFGDRTGEAYAASRLSLTAYHEGDYAEARRWGFRGHEVFEEIAHRWGTAASLCRIGLAELGLRHIREARTCFSKALKQAASMNHVPLILYSLTGMACLLAEEGREAEAVELFAMLEVHPQTSVTYLDLARKRFSETETALSERATAAIRERGGVADLDRVVAGLLGKGT